MWFFIIMHFPFQNKLLIYNMLIPNKLGKNSYKLAKNDMKLNDLHKFYCHVGLFVKFRPNNILGSRYKQKQHVK